MRRRERRRGSWTIPEPPRDSRSRLPPAGSDHRSTSRNQTRSSSSSLPHPHPPRRRGRRRGITSSSSSRSDAPRDCTARSSTSSTTTTALILSSPPSGSRRRYCFCGRADMANGAERRLLLLAGRWIGPSSPPRLLGDSPGRGVSRTPSFGFCGEFSVFSEYFLRSSLATGPRFVVPLTDTTSKIG